MSDTKTPAPDVARMRGHMRLYIFFREGMFYSIELPDTDDIAEHVRCNPGTLRVEDALTGEIIWPRKYDA